MSGAPVVSPEQYAELVRGASDEQLARAMSESRREILEQIFSAIPGQLEPGAKRLDVVLEWRITGGPGESVDRWQLVISAGRCEATRDGADRPSAVITVEPVAFLKLVAGVVSGPSLFMRGQLAIDGDLLAAARAYRSFRFPRVRR